jgi:4-amino-4-deoxy-L-arabinose transferase-like glycosyltransferase
LYRFYIGEIRSFLKSVVLSGVMTTADGGRNGLRWWEAILLIVGLLFFAGQAFLSSPRKSASFDEEYHVAAGYAYLKTGDFRLNQDHPPLINLLSALPLLFRRDVNLPLATAAWEQADFFNFARIFLWEVQENPQSILEWARWPTMVLGMVLVAALFWWARQMAGVWAGWIALILAVFDPNLIANSRLVTTDLGVTCFLLLTMWRLWCWLVRPSLPNAFLTGLFAGLTMASKYTGLMVWPIMVGVVVIWRLGDWEIGRFSDWKKNLKFLISNFFTMGLIAYFVLWAVYRFDVSPFPASFYTQRVWQTFRVIEDEPLASFLLGETSLGGWWYYFPVALAVKTSLPLLILAVIGTAVTFKTVGWRRSAVLWLPPLLFLLLAMAGSITIGYRHILPVVPFIIMLASFSGNWGIKILGYWDNQYSAIPISQLLITLLLLWHIIGTVRLFPHQEAFFNELVGGPAGGGQVLADSNLDWGQDLIALREVMAEMGIEEVYLGYFGTAVPEFYGIRYQPIPGFLRHTAGAEVNAYNPYTPPPGWYAIGQTSLQLGLMLQNTDVYAYFREQTPIAKAGYSINLYHVEYPVEMPVARVVVTGTAVSDLSLQELEALTANRIPYSVLQDQDTEYGIRNTEYGRRLITKWTADESTTIIPFSVPFTPPADFQPVNANFADVLTLTGYTVADTTRKPGEPFELRLYWQRGTADIPMPAPTKAAPLAAFVHLSGADPGQIVAQYDGWGTAVSTLEPGDIIIQQITLIPPIAGEHFLRVGLYSPQSGQRFPLTDGSGDFVTLASIAIIEE